MKAQRISRLRTLLPITSVMLAVLGCVICSATEGLRLTLVNRDLVGARLREGSVRAKERQDLIERLFREVGCDVALQAVDKKSSNVICDLPGKTSDTLIVGAHFDFAEKGQGIVDDWSGASMLVSLYQTLKSNVSKHSFEFVAFAEEERGLLGSTRYVKQLSARSNIVPQAFINLECLGLTSPKVWVTRSSPILVDRLLEIANAMRIPLEGVNVDNVGDDDTHPFLSKKVPVISIHSITQEKWQILHTEKDNLSAINSTDYYNAYRLIAFYLNYLDARLSPEMIPAARR